MDSNAIDKVSALFSKRRRTRREVIKGGAAGLAAAGLTAAGVNAASAQGDTSDTDDPGHKVDYLFVQSFESGSIEAKDGAEGAYTVTLQHGLGQTIYFSDRPERIVGATPSGDFIEGLGFEASNPPNAALVIGVGDGATDIAVVELTNPVYDVASSTAVYDIAVLENYSDNGQAFQADPVDLSAVAASFGTAHLFIDGCSQAGVGCRERGTGEWRLLTPAGVYLDYCYAAPLCVPCEPYGGGDGCATYRYWIDKCNESPAACPTGDCTPAFPGTYWDQHCN